MKPLRNPPGQLMKLVVDDSSNVEEDVAILRRRAEDALRKAVLSSSH